MLKEKKHVQIVIWDVRQTLLGMMKVNVCCVLSVRRLHELAVLNVKIVVLEDTVMVAKNVKLVNIVPLLRVILRLVLTALLVDTNLTWGKQAVYHVHLENTNTLKEKKHVQTVKLDVQQTLLGTMQQTVMHV